MKTIKPIATISYNSESFLLKTLDRLYQNEMIVFYAYIAHQKEEDELKDHYHVYIEPAKQIDTLWLAKQFTQVVINSEKPLGVMPFRSSKFADWYWYSIHDTAYLLSHGGQVRKYHYGIDNVMTSNREYLFELVRTNPNPKAELLKIQELINQGFSPIQIAVSLNIKTNNLHFFLQGVEELESAMRFHRLGKPHNGEFNESGEWIEDKEGED